MHASIGFLSRRRKPRSTTQPGRMSTTERTRKSKIGGCCWVCPTGFDCCRSFIRGEMKRSVSSVLAERIRQRRAVTPTKSSVRFVRFSPEEMAYDVPNDTSGFIPVGRGPRAIFAKPAKGSKVVQLEPDVAAVFKDADSVNNALRKLIQAMPQRLAKRKKSA